jgi:hypothetical protein
MVLLSLRELYSIATSAPTLSGKRMEKAIAVVAKESGDQER